MTWFELAPDPGAALASGDGPSPFHKWDETRVLDGGEIGVDDYGGGGSFAGRGDDPGT